MYSFLRDLNKLNVFFKATISSKKQKVSNIYNILNHTSLLTSIHSVAVDVKGKPIKFQPLQSKGRRKLYVFKSSKYLSLHHLIYNIPMSPDKYTSVAVDIRGKGIDRILIMPFSLSFCFFERHRIICARIHYGEGGGSYSRDFVFDSLSKNSGICASSCSGAGWW